MLLMLVVVRALVAGIPQHAAGVAAKGICSAALVAGRPMTTLLADDVLPASPVLRLISIEVDSARQSVTGRFAGLFARTAVRLPDRGCVLDLPAAPVAAALRQLTGVPSPSATVLFAFGAAVRLRTGRPASPLRSAARRASHRCARRRRD